MSTPPTISLLFLSAIYLLLALLSWRRRAASGAKSVTFLMLAAGVYLLGCYFEIHSSKPAGLILWLRFEYLVIFSILAWLLLFGLQYSGRNKHKRRLIMIGDTTRHKQAEACLGMRNSELIQQIHELNQYIHEIKQLNEMSTLLQSCTKSEEVYPLIGEQLQRILPQISGGLYIYQPDIEIMELVSAWNLSWSLRPAFKPEACWGMHWQDFHHVGSNIPDMLCEHVESGTTFDYLCIPMTIQGELVGLLYLCSSFAEIDEKRLQLVRTASDTILLALYNLKIREVMVQQSIRDPLTQLFNRRYMEETLQRELLRAERMGNHLSICMGDLDHFKAINDQYGHLFGDKVLQQVSRIIEANIRSEDIACRYGGEEFVLIIPGIPWQVAVQRANYLREKIEQLLFKVDELTAERITISFGVAAYPEQGLDAESLLQAADTALYLAKQEGRDCVMAAQS